MTDHLPEDQTPKVAARRRPAAAPDSVLPASSDEPTGPAALPPAGVVAARPATTRPASPTVTRPNVAPRKAPAAPPSPSTPAAGDSSALAPNEAPATEFVPVSFPPVTPGPALDVADPSEAHPHLVKQKRDTVDSEHAIAPGRATPPERFDPANAWDFSDLDAATTANGLDAAHRLDPYWDGLWGAGSAASWLSADLARRQVEAGLGSLPSALKVDQDIAMSRVLGPRGWQQRLALLGALFSYRTMTAEQAAAFVGDKSVASLRTASMASLFASGIMDVGVFSNGLRRTDLTGRGALYRPARGGVFDDEIKDRLSWPEWVSVTGGQKWVAGTTYDRHNILGTELALRLAEYTQVGAVLGERFSSLDHLAGSGIGYPEMIDDQRAADLTAVRPDGMRVVFEMTANTGVYFFEKVRRWARLLAERPLDASGLTVVFVIVQHPERLDDDNDGYLPRAKTYQAIAAATKEFPGSVRDRVAERMGVATWREWFPARGKVHDAFFTLRVDRPTGRGDRLWEPADMLDPTDGRNSAGAHGRPFTPRDPAAMTAILDNAALLGNTPHWLRERRTSPDLWPLLLKKVGLNEIPAPTPDRPTRTKGRPLGQGVGSARDTKPPRRLLGLTA